MKKILIIFLSFFLFIPEVFANAKINSLVVNVELDQNGLATVTEEYKLETQDNIYFERNFYDVNNVIISDLTIHDLNVSTFKEKKKINKKNEFEYAYIDKGKTKKIAFTTNGKANTVILQYHVDGMITEFDDTSAINWYFLNNESLSDISSLDVYISGTISFNENNTALYAIGKNISCVLSGGKIHLFASNINSKSKIKLIGSISDVNYSSNKKVNSTLKEYYDKVSKESPVVAVAKDFFSNIFILILVGASLLFFLLVIISNLIKKNKDKNDYNKIISYNRERTLGELNSVPYYDAIPCNGDLYKIYFYANYFNITKHRSTLIGAILLKWVFEGIVEIEAENEKYYIKINDGKIFDRELDLELYNILKDASNNLILDSTKLIRYCEVENVRLINWYRKAVKDTILTEFKSRNMNIKGNKIIFNKIITNEAIKIQGLKRYLLNFNQVPRQTELNEEVYKYLLILSVLLGVDENLYQEILRKNPDNEKAQILKKFSNVKYLYKNLYSKVIDVYKKKRHKGDRNCYNPLKKV